MSKITGGTMPTDPSWSNLGNTVGATGANPVITPSLVPAASGVAGAGISPVSQTAY